MTDVHGFDKRNTGRIVEAVRKSEAPPRRAPGSSGPIPGAAIDPFPRAMSYRIWIQIDSSAEADSPAQNRWTYTVTQVRKTAAGYDGWTAVEDAADGILSAEAFNMAEDMNTGDGVESMGVDVDGTDFPAGMSVMQLPAGLILPADVIFIGGDGDNAGDREIWINATNGIDGTCED
jgi:hypothetical protein